MSEDYTENLEEKWEKATLANNFIFYKVMHEHPDACKRLVEMLLDIKIHKIEMISESTLVNDHESKGIRLDVYLKDSKRIIDVEIQIKDTKNLPLRARYYQASLDVDDLKQGEVYDLLKDNHIIFICLEDIFKQNMPVYTFQNRCNENLNIELCDRTWKHFFIAKNCAKMLKDKELQAFFELLISNSTKTVFTEKLKDYIDDAKHNTQWRLQFMIWENNLAQAKKDARDAGFAEGIQQGLEQGIQQGAEQKSLECAVNAIRQLNITPDQASATFNVPLEKILTAMK